VRCFAQVFYNLLEKNYLLTHPLIKETKKRMIKIRNKILAKSVATPAMPENPKTPAIIAMIKNVIAQLSIGFLRFKKYLTTWNGLLESNAKTLNKVLALFFTDKQ